MHEKAQQTARLYVRIALTYAALLAALSVLSGDIVTFLLGKEFAPSTPVLHFMLWAVAFRVLAHTGRVLLNAAGERVSHVQPREDRGSRAPRHACCRRLPGAGWVILLKLAAATVAYAVLLFLLDEWRATRAQWRELKAVALG